MDCSTPGSFPNLEPVCCSMSGSSCCFFLCIQISQEAGKVVWYSHLFKNFPLFVVIHTIKGFRVVDEAEDVFLEFPCFLYDPVNVGSLLSCSSALSKWSLYIWKFSVHVLLKPSLKAFENNLTSMRNERNCTVVEHALLLPFFAFGMKADLFQSYGHCWVFQIWWYIECGTLTASSFRVLNSSAYTYIHSSLDSFPI